MSDDEQFGHQLGVLLRREIEPVRADPDLVHTLRRRQARRTWVVRTAIATPVVAAAAAILVTSTGLGAPHPGLTSIAEPPANAQPPTSAAQFENVAFVQEQTIKALGQASQYVIYAKSSYDGGHYETWIDRANQRYRNDVYSGTPAQLNQSHAVSGPDGDQTVVTVDYDSHWWATRHETFSRPQSAPPDITDAQEIQRAITDGTVELLGHETVNGFDTLHLRLYGPDRTYRIDMWVDATTYLPVQDVAGKSSGQAGAAEFPASYAVTTTYSWLPRTDENLARLVLTHPPGYEEK